MTDDEEEFPTDKNEIQAVLKTLVAKLEDLSTCNELIIKHGAALQRSLSELEQLDASPDLSTKTKAVSERATLFRITANAMINVSYFSCYISLRLDCECVILGLSSVC